MLDIIDVPDAKSDDFKQLFREIQSVLEENLKQGEKTFVMFYYAGHGIQRTMTYAVCNEDKEYPLEKLLRNSATIKNSYIAAVLDCCRSDYRHRGEEKDA